MPGRTEQEWVQYLQTMMFVEILRNCHYYLLVGVLCWKYCISLYEDMSHLRSLVLWFWCDICGSNLKTSSFHRIVCVKFRDCHMKQIPICILLSLRSLLQWNILIFTMHAQWYKILNDWRSGKLYVSVVYFATKSSSQTESHVYKISKK